MSAIHSAIQDISLVIFIVSLLLILHSYLFYPISIKLISGLFKRKFRVDYKHTPTVSFIIAAYNEEKVIGDMLNSLKNLDYDQSKLEVFIGSDNSTDRTHEIVEKMKETMPNLNLIVFRERKGKPEILNELSLMATGDILAFCDSNTLYSKDALREMVKYFADEKVGGVCGRLHLKETEGSVKTGNKEKTYWDFESWIKESEGKLGVLIGAWGGIYTIRRKYYPMIPSGKTIMDDFYIGVKVLETGSYFLYEPKATAQEDTAPTLHAEFKRKIRIQIGNLNVIRYLHKISNPFSGLKSYALWSHKYLRWFSPFFFILVFLSNVPLAIDNKPFVGLLLMQGMFYLSAFIGYLFARMNMRVFPFTLVYYFVVTVSALFFGAVKFITSPGTGSWEPTRRV